MKGENKNRLQIRFEHNNPKNWTRTATLQEFALNGDMFNEAKISIKVANMLISHGMVHSS